MEGINALAAHSGMFVIEDAAQALGSRDLQGRPLGTLSDSGCFSLSVAKIISSGQGGFIATSNAETDACLRAMRTHGVENTVRPDIWVMPGFNFRFTDVLASIGIVQVGLLDERLRRANEVYRLYSVGLEGCAAARLIRQDGNEIGSYIEVLAEDRVSLVHSLAERAIETRPFYPDLDTAHYWNRDDSITNSRSFAEHGVYLPSWPAITDNQIQRVVDEIWALCPSGESVSGT